MSDKPPADKFPGQQCTVRGRPLPALPKRWRNIVRATIAQARATPSKHFGFDSKTQTFTTFREFIQRSAALSGPVLRTCGKHGVVGVLVPTTVPAAIANLAVLMSANAVVNLNLLSDEAIEAAVSDAGIEYVITSREFMDAKKLTVNAKLLYLEDLRHQVTTGDIAIGFAVASPVRGTSEVLPGARVSSDTTAVIMYTSGSEGIAKGAELSHSNILHNIWQIRHHVDIRPDWKVLGVLPFFHSFGATVTLWAVACLGLTVFFHPNGLDGRAVGKLMAQGKINLAASTPSVMRTWMPRVSAEQFESVDMLMLGSEKLKPELAADIERRLGKKPCEGYGCTETSPCIAANVPQMVETVDGRWVSGFAEGSVGFAVPGTDIAILDLDTYELLPPGKDGLIFVRGPQVMKGYFRNPQQTAAVLQNGWYYTGDFGHVDDDGRLYLTDRMNRVIKMGGEWVALMRIEAAIRKATGVNEMSIICAGVPDDVKGERPVVLHIDLGMAPEAVSKQLAEEGLPSLMVPKPRDYFLVEQLPIGTTGKLDLKAVKRLALARLEQRDCK